MKRAPRKRKSKRRPPRRRRGCLGRLVVAGLKLGIVTVLLWSVAALALYAYALTFDLRTVFEMPERSVVIDRDGNYYSRLAGENRLLVPFDMVSNHFVNALLAREDTRFYWHKGIDPIGIARAVVRNFIAGGFREGASTITQQLARNSFPLGGKTLQRKLVEAALAYRIETELTKEEILEAYMNRIYFGSGFYGIEAASQAYFGKPSRHLDLGEAAMLAGLIRSPNNFSPFASPRKALRERDAVLKRMRDVGFITDAQYKAAMASRPDIAPRPRSTFQENWAMHAILSELDLVLDPEQKDAGGLRIQTTIDPRLQRVAEESLARRLADAEKHPRFSHRPMSAYRGRDFSEDSSVPYLEGAAIAIDSRSGGIRAIVGGRDLHASSFNRAMDARRPVGSAAKPFVFAKAFEAGLKPNEKLSDDRLSPSEMPAGFGNYSPGNSDGTFRGELPAADGLIDSRNTMSVRAGLRAGLDRVADCLRLAGLATDPDPYPALCLGTFESNLKDLTAAYTAFANKGVKLQPYLIEEVTDARGNILFKATHGRIPVLERPAAELTTKIMREVLTRGTGAGARKLGAPRDAAGKTGTTNSYHDAWFIGFTRDLTCGVWVGFDRPRTIRAGGDGASLALPIWADIMSAGSRD
jgi:penicillin-binding protein 1A